MLARIREQLGWWLELPVCSGFHLPNTARFCRCSLRPVNISDRRDWVWDEIVGEKQGNSYWKGTGFHGRVGGCPCSHKPNSLSFLAWKFYSDMLPGILTRGKFIWFKSSQKCQRELLGGDGNTLGLDYSGYWMAHWKWTHFTVCKLYLHVVDLRKKY